MEFSIPISGGVIHILSSMKEDLHLAWNSPSQGDACGGWTTVNMLQVASRNGHSSTSNLKRPRAHEIRKGILLGPVHKDSTTPEFFEHSS
jgi:hypothetical protein